VKSSGRLTGETRYTKDSSTSITHDLSVRTGQKIILSAYSAATLFEGQFTGCNSGDAEQAGSVLAIKKEGFTYLVVNTGTSSHLPRNYSAIEGVLATDHRTQAVAPLLARLLSYPHLQSLIVPSENKYVTLYSQVFTRYQRIYMPVLSNLLILMTDVYAYENYEMI
jgi:hypothetical protein